MNWAGYSFASVALLSFACLGILSKLAERRGCAPLATTTVVFASSSLFMTVQVALVQRSTFVPPGRVLAIALAFGIASVLASWFFLRAIQFGKITTSWVVINLSAALPTIASTVLYSEPMGLRKIAVLVLAGAAILLLWKDMQAETREQAGAEAATGR
jgi:drug/metabolite transporter (DMT)-like permease